MKKIEFNIKISLSNIKVKDGRYSYDYSAEVNGVHKNGKIESTYSISDSKMRKYIESGEQLHEVLEEIE